MNRRMETSNELLIKTDDIYEQNISEPVQFVAVPYHNRKWQLFFFVTVSKPEIEGYHRGKEKGKAIPLQALTGPEGSRRLRLPDFKTIGT
jgi:hypothetical protein